MQTAHRFRVAGCFLTRVLSLKNFCYASYEMVNVRSLIDDIGGRVRESSHPRVEDLQKLIILNQQRLQMLQEQQAQFGISTPPHIITEIKQIEVEIEQLQSELDSVI